MGAFASIVLPILAFLVSVLALALSLNANREQRKSRNLEALFNIHNMTRQPEMVQIRKDLCFGTKYRSLQKEPYDEKHDEVHRLLSLYEALGVATKNRLLDEDLVKTLFPSSIPESYDAAVDYITFYRTRNENWAKNFEWLALRYPRAKLT